MGGFEARLRDRESPAVSVDEGEDKEEWYSASEGEEDTSVKPSKPPKPPSKRVPCPYSPDENQHFTTESKLMWHILKCEDYIKSKDQFVVCPYDAMHVFKKGENMEKHVSSQHSDQLAKIASVVDYFQSRPEENPWTSDWPEESAKPGESQEDFKPELEEIAAATP